MAKADDELIGLLWKAETALALAESLRGPHQADVIRAHQLVRGIIGSLRKAGDLAIARASEPVRGAA